MSLEGGNKTTHKVLFGNHLDDEEIIEAALYCI
jgi:hypothetical protein